MASAFLVEMLNHRRPKSATTRPVELRSSIK
jgi:hypothetical protein